MDQKIYIPLKAHFHIHWDGVARLDWERFDTIEKAVLRARELARPGEIFKIVEVDGGSCPRCCIGTAAAAS